MPQLLVQITEEQAAWLDARCDRFSPKSRLVRDLIDSARLGLDIGVRLEKPSLLQAAQPEGGEGFASTSISNKEIDKQPLEVKQKTRARAKGPFDGRVVSADLVPADLLDCQQLLPEFWSVKKGVRSESVWNRVCEKLRAWTPEQRRDALERAIASGWGDVFEPKGASPAQTKGSVDEGAARLERFRERGWI
jgi:hypothetical protein